MSEQISCTNNAESILWFAKKQFPDIGKVTQQSLNPQGPKGRFHILAPWSHAIYNFSPESEGGEGLPGLADGSEAGRALVRFGRQLLRAVPDMPMTMRRSGTPSRATCRTATR